MAFTIRDSPPPGWLAAERIDAPWQTLVLICSKCSGARKGPDAREIRKGLKSRLGKSKQLRVVEVDCLQVCPDHAVTVCTVRAREGAVELQLVREHAELDALAASLRP